MENRKKNLSFILYEHGAHPKYFTLNKRMARALLITLPIAAFICIGITMLGLIYFKEIRHSAQRKEPAIIKNLRAKNASLKESIVNLEKEKKVLQVKVNKGVNLKDGPGFLSFFKTSLGREDKTTSPETALEDIKVVKEAGKIKLFFKLTNLTNPVRRLNGFIFVLMQTGNNISVWPSNIFKDEGMQLSFSDGEYFGTSRFRPVEATFPMASQSRAVFKVIVFNKFGDFIYKQIIAKDL